MSAETGLPLAGVTITAYRTSPVPTVTARVTSAADGNFAATGLPTGKYGFCVFAASQALLNPCEWHTTEVLVDVVDGKITSASAIKVQLASVLKVRLNDQGGFLAAKQSETVPPHVLVGVWEKNGAFHPALEVNKDATGIDYSISIPFDTPVQVHIQSKSVTIAQPNLSPIATKGVDTSIQHLSTLLPTLQPALTFNAVGRNP